jgi:hypothetical protein
MVTAVTPTRNVNNAACASATGAVVFKKSVCLRGCERRHLLSKVNPRIAR